MVAIVVLPITLGTTVDDIKSCTTQNKEFTIIP